MIRDIGYPRGVRTWLLIAVGFVFFGLFNATIVLTSGLAERDDMPLAYPFIMELTGSLCALVLFPSLIRLMLRYPLGRDDWWRRLPLHVLASMVYGVCHTLLMWGSRTVIYGLIEWPRYEYGAMGYRFLMEYQKQILYYAILYSVLALLGYVRRNRARELQAAQLEARLGEARLAALKMQLNPHFLFNTLNMISNLVHEDPRRADRMIALLADFLRLTLRHADTQEVVLERELEFVDAYLEIMQARFRDRLTVETDIEPGAERALVPHLLLQPLVENAVTHAVDDARPGRIRLAAARHDDRLRITVRDDGAGPDSPTTREGGGIGLKNTAARLKQLYGDEHVLRLLGAAGGGCEVTVELPWREEDPS